MSLLYIPIARDNATSGNIFTSNAGPPSTSMPMAMPFRQTARKREPSQRAKDAAVSEAERAARMKQVPRKTDGGQVGRGRPPKKPVIEDVTLTAAVEAKSKSNAISVSHPSSLQYINLLNIHSFLFAMNSAPGPVLSFVRTAKVHCRASELRLLDQRSEDSRLTVSAGALLSVLTLKIRQRCLM